MKTLYPVQEKHAVTLMAGLIKHGAALDASSTGTGKTLVGAEIARWLKLPTLVVCPKALIPPWRAELAERGMQATVVNYEKLRTGKTGLGKFVNKRWVWSLAPGSLIIWDEVQKAQGAQSQNGKMLAAAKPFVNLMLSATAAEDPTEMRALGFVLGLHKYTDFYPWLLKHNCKPNPWGALVFKGDPKALARVHERIFAEGRGSRLTTEDLADHFLETQIITEPLDFGDEGEIAKLYEEMEAEVLSLQTEMADDSKDPAAAALVAQLRARQRVELLKVPLMEEMANGLLKEGRSVAIFVNFNATLRALCERLGTECLIAGGQSGVEREWVINDFQQNVSPVIVCNIAAGGVGVSLHDTLGGHPRTALISPSWNAKELLQVLGRVHRAGGKTPSQQRILFAANTIEEKIEKSLKEKMKNIEIINQGVLTTASGLSNPHIPQMPDTEIPQNPEPATGCINPAQPQAVKEVDHASRGHARYSPSSLGYREMCPSWENDNDSNKDTTASEEGTRCHEACETGDLTGLNEEQELIVSMCLGYVMALKNGMPKPVVELKEVKLTVLDQFGSVDVVLIHGAEAHVVDYKFGRRSVADAEDNAQLQAYILGVFDKFPKVERVEGHLLLPRRDEASRHVYTRAKDYKQIKLRISTIIARAKDGKIFTATVKGCEFCGKKGSCAALASIALNRSASIRLAMGAEGEGTAESLGLDMHDPDTIAKLLNISSVMEKWAEAVRAEALRLSLYEGVEIPGYAQAERKSPRSITSAAGAWTVLKDRMSVDDFMASVARISITELEKNFAATAERGQKGKSKQVLENLLRDACLFKDESVVTFLRAVKA